MSAHNFQTVPILRIFDEEKAKDFYIGFMGFTVDWEHRFGEGMPLYMQVSRENLVLHLSEHHGDSTPGSTVFVRTTNLDDLHADITSKGYRYMNPAIEEVPWNARLMQVIDPFGNKLRFNEYIGGAED